MYFTSEGIAFVTLIGLPAAHLGLRLLTTWWRPTTLQLAAGVVVWLLWQRFAASGFSMGLRPSSRLRGRGNGKVAIVTGANTGIGFESAVALAESGAKVIVTCRDTTKVTATIAAIRARLSPERRGTAELQGFTMELNSQASVRRCADDIIASGSPIHILLNNAGGMFTVGPDGKSLPRTEEGNEQNMGANFASVVLFTDLLTSRLAATRGRVINLSSEAPERMGVTPAKAQQIVKEHPGLAFLGPAGGVGPGGLLYGASKLGNFFHAASAAREDASGGVQYVSVHPGVVVTEFYRFVQSQFVTNILKLFTLLVLKTPYEGSLTSVHCALSSKLVNGAYYADESVVPLTALRRDRALEDEMMRFARRTAPLKAS